MSGAIQFLEAQAMLPLSRDYSSASYTRNVSLLAIDQLQKKALIGRDADALNALLGGRPKMMMQIWAPMEDSPDADEDQGEDTDGDPTDEPSEQ